MAVAEAGKKGAEESDLAVSFHVPDSLLIFLLNTLPHTYYPVAIHNVLYPNPCLITHLVYIFTQPVAHLFTSMVFYWYTDLFKF